MRKMTQRRKLNSQIPVILDKTKLELLKIVLQTYG
jgi:hypothetical protein